MKVWVSTVTLLIYQFLFLFVIGEHMGCVNALPCYFSNLVHYSN